MSGSEMHEEGPGGKKQDRRLHEHILQGVKPEDEKKLRRASRRRSGKLLDKASLDRLFGTEEETS